MVEKEILKNVQEGTTAMSVFIKCNGSPGRQLLMYLGGGGYIIGLCRI